MKPIHIHVKISNDEKKRVNGKIFIEKQTYTCIGLVLPKPSIVTLQVIYNTFHISVVWFDFFNFS